MQEVHPPCHVVLHFVRLAIGSPEPVLQSPVAGDQSKSRLHESADGNLYDIHYKYVPEWQIQSCLIRQPVWP